VAVLVAVIGVGSFARLGTVTSVPEPRPVIRGELVYLRPAEREDIPTFVRWFTDADVLENLAMFSPMSLAGETAWFEEMLTEHGRTRYHFVICLLADDRPIGTIGLEDIAFVDGRAELGIAIGEKGEWDHGYGTDAVRALCDFGFGELRLERIGLFVYDGNDRARRSYEKAGFRHEGTLRRAHFARGEHHDVHVMGIVRDEWRARTPGAEPG
jgi:RimJ/RimL family protein N-acetyltransferase